MDRDVMNWEINEVCPTIAPANCLKRVSRLQHMRGNLGRTQWMSWVELRVQGDQGIWHLKVRAPEGTELYRERTLENSRGSQISIHLSANQHQKCEENTWAKKRTTKRINCAQNSHGPGILQARVEDLITHRTLGRVHRMIFPQ